VMDTAAGVIGFVCLMFFCSTDFPTVFHDTTYKWRLIFHSDRETLFIFHGFSFF